MASFGKEVCLIEEALMPTRLLYDRFSDYFGAVSNREVQSLLLLKHEDQSDQCTWKSLGNISTKPGLDSLQPTPAMKLKNPALSDMWVRQRQAKAEQMPYYSPVGRQS